MPYIAVTTSKALSDEQKDELKKTIGQKISLIPGKTEAALMVDISDNHTMYFAGEKRKLAYVDVRCYGSTEFENKKALTEALFDAVELQGAGEVQRILQDHERELSAVAHSLTSVN